MFESNLIERPLEFSSWEEYERHRRAEDAVTSAKALTDCPLEVGMTITRRRNGVRGRIVKKEVRKEAPGLYYEFRVYCRVAWEGAADGSRRFGGGAWNITTKVLASSLIRVD